MKASQVLCLLMVFLPALCLAGSGESIESKKRGDTCGLLVQEPPKPSSSPVVPTSVPTPPPGQCYCTPAPGNNNNNNGFHSECPLMVSFRNMSSSLDSSEQVEWEAWLEDCENNFLSNSSLTDEQKVVAISVSFKLFCESHKSIHKKISYLQIAGWGVCEDFLYVHISIQVRVTMSVSTVDANGNCQVCQALKNLADSAQNSQDQSDLDSLEEDVRGCLEDIRFTYEQRLAQVHLKFEAIFMKNSNLKSQVEGCQIPNYGSMASFMSVCEMYNKLVTIKTVLSGSSEVDCVLLQAFDNATQDVSIDVLYRQQLKEMKDKFKAFFMNSTSVAARMLFVSQTCYQSRKLMPWLVSIYEQIKLKLWGNVFDAIFCSGICTTNGCGNGPDDGPGPNQVSTSMAPSTAAPASTQKPADCSSVGGLIMVDSSNNTVLITVLTNNYATWNATQKMGFNNCFNQIRQATYDNVAYPSQSSKLSKCKQSFLQYNSGNAAKQATVLDIQINSWAGTIRQFCGCIA